MASNPDPVADYFTRFPHFTYDATTPAVAEFSRLAATSGWGRYSADYRRERGRFVDAFVEYVNTTYGEGRGNLTAWQALCRVCKINPAPTSITKCRKALQNVYVNVFDAMEALKRGGTARTFANIPELRNYTTNANKMIPRNKAKAGGALKDLLRKLF